MNFILFHECKLRSFVKFSALAIFFILILAFFSAASAKSEDHCWRTGEASQFKSPDPETFLTSMLEEFNEMRQNFPEPTKEERGEYISGEFSDALNVKYKINAFIESILPALNYQKSAEDGDILGYLYLVNELQEALWDDVVVNFMMAEPLGIGVFPDDSLISYIKHIGNPFVSSLNSHILLCIIPIEVNRALGLEGR